MDTTLITLLSLAAYFLLLLGISRHGRQKQDNDTFFRGGHQSPWMMVGFGMIGASISGVSFISVPGWVGTTGMTYLQMCAGFFFGYLIVAFVLLPLYYRLGLTSIYAYLGTRFGKQARQTGAVFFLLSKLTGAAARLYLACLVLCSFLFPSLGGSTFAIWGFMGVAATILLLIWLYTRRGGIFTLVRTDALQTFCLFLALLAILTAAVTRLGGDFGDTVREMTSTPLCQIFDWDPGSSQNFWRQFLSGIFVVIVMTGLDQDMMQKNLTCRNLREAQKNMCTYGACFLPVNLLLLGLGVLLYALCVHQGLPVPATGDELLPSMVSSGMLGTWVIIPLVIGIVAAAFSSADSALTSLTTCFCIDILRIEERGLPSVRATQIRRSVHIAVAIAFLFCILLFRLTDDHHVIHVIYVMASYTYGPLLGLYVFGLYTRRKTRNRYILPICLASPLLCAFLDYVAPLWWNYRFGYELLMLNGMLTFMGLYAFSQKSVRTGFPPAPPTSAGNRG